ncbi:hypothetical protein CNMCM5878_003573 [Aspergillus fumigatiaffinis]|nr:hypothetical protein CNMCM5878_003573 [Aspergillus fumigatiaffinis]
MAAMTMERGYHNTSSPYVPPNDAIEQDRLDAQADAIVAMIGGVPANVVGVDITPVPARALAAASPNLQWETGNILDVDMEKQTDSLSRGALAPNTISYFFGRMLFLGINDWHKYFQVASLMLQDQGIIEHQDLDWKFYRVGTDECLSDNWKWYARLMEAVKEAGLSEISGSNAASLMETAGLKVIEARKFEFSFVPSAKTPNSERIGQSDEIVSSEEAFFRMFYDIEALARIVYIDMVDAIVAFEENRKADSLQRLQQLKPKLDKIYQVFYDGLVDAKVSRKVWLSYCQGFQGWGVGRVIDGRHVKYDGLSGNHVLIFQAIDAFFGMERYLIDENMIRYIPVRQREFTSVLRRHSIRAQIEKGEYEEIRADISKLVQAMRVFRAAHRTRVIPYLKQPAPERLIMTVGKSVLENEGSNGLEDALAPLNKMMTTRLQETV